MRTLNDIVGIGACSPCRGRITECSVEHPTCAECRKRGTQCVYSESTSEQSAAQPRPDPNAPRKPKPAQILFGEHVRQDPALRDAPSRDIEHAIESRWENLSEEERQAKWEGPVARRLQIHQEMLESYKDTADYQRYQMYLEAFTQRRQSQEITILPDANALSTIEPVLIDSNNIPSEQHDADGDQEMSVDAFDPGPEGQLSDPASPVKSGMVEVRKIRDSLGVSPHLIRVATYPPEDMTVEAVGFFLGGTGALLYLWNPEEAKSLTQSIFHSQKDGSPVQAAEVFAMAAIGSYCDGDTGKTRYHKQFLDFFVCLLSAQYGMSDLRRMRLFACLAIFRFTSSVESARLLMLAALDIGRQVFTSPSFLIETAEDELRHWWDVFRSVLFLESWFAFNCNHESRVTREDLTLYHTSRQEGKGGIAIFQERISELGQLGAYIALDLKDADRPRVEQARTHLESLDKWHRTLPAPMQLSRISLANPFTMNASTKRCLLQSHILFLGIFIEPYRNCLVELGKYRLDNTPTESEELEGLLHIEEQCVLAARQSARVASLLQTDGLVRAHCWISMYTSFTGCGILLFSASQKLLQLLGEEIGHDLSYASSHLNLLSLCSYDNSIARTLHADLQVLFNDIREVTVSPVYRKMRDARIFVKDPMLVPRTHYDSVPGAQEISRSILDSARRIMGLVQEAIVLKEA